MAAAAQAAPRGAAVEAAAGIVTVANLLQLCKELRLPVAYKVFEAASRSGVPTEQAQLKDQAAEQARETAPGPRGGAPERAQQRTFFVVVHVLSDSAFRKFYQHCSRSDLLLHRGLLLQVGGAAAPAGEGHRRGARAESLGQCFRRRFAHRWWAPPARPAGRAPSCTLGSH
jgi:hypothetical protein